MAALTKFDPRYSMYLRGFDRRGCTASINNTTINSLIVSGYFSDIADFIVLMIYDADDLFGHLYSNKYLPDFDLSGLVLTFDLETTNCFNPTSKKFQSVPWGKLSWILNDSAGTNGTYDLPILSTTGDTPATITYTVNGLPVAFDRVSLIYLGNTVYDYIVNPGDTTSDVAAALVSQINGSTVTTGLTAIQSGADFTISADPSLFVGSDGNTIAFTELHKTATTYLTPAGTDKMTGGVDPTSITIELDFDSLFGINASNIRQFWLTIAPSLNIDSTPGDSPTLISYDQIDFSYEITNIVLSGSGNDELKVSNRESVVIDSRDVLCDYVGSWSLVAGNYSRGFSKYSTTINNKVTITYHYPNTHDLYLGAVLSSTSCIVEVELDGTPLSDIDCYINSTIPISARRVIDSGLASGVHILELTLKAGSFGNNFYFDFIQACEASDPSNPSVVYSNVNAALDYDTDQTYKLPSSRVIWNMLQLGLEGNINLYAGVFFALIRSRRGGYFHSAIVTVAGVLNTGTGFGDGDAFFITIGFTTIGVAAFPQDTVDTIAQRFVNAVNTLFVGVRGELTGTGEFTITILSPINGFTFSVDDSGIVGAATFTSTGDIDAGNEGIWEVDSTQTNPLNRGFIDWLSDFSDICVDEILEFTVAWSLELLAPPDQNTISDAWIQRFNDGSLVLTSTTFGSWGAGFVEAVSGSGTLTITQTGHGYLDGYKIRINGNDYFITVVDADSYQITTANVINIGDSVLAYLQTAHCAFNPLTVTDYLSNVYLQSTDIQDAAGVLAPINQFGEVLHWFFDNGSSMALYDENQKDAANTILGRPLALFTNPDDDPSINFYEDTDFLRDRLQDHINTIRTNVLAIYPSALFELLYPNDVNWYTVYTNNVYPFDIGGQLNAYINLPSDYYTDGSDIDIFKTEALAFGVSYRDMNNIKDSVEFPLLSPRSWPTNKVSYLMPIFNGGVPFNSEFLEAINKNMVNVVLFAADHINLLHWNIQKILAERFSDNQIV